MSATFTEQIELVKCECGRCGGTYAITGRFRSYSFENSGSWHCPYCQCEWGFFKSQAQKAQEELQKVQAELRTAKCQILSERSQREQAELEHKKKMDRIKKGVCPCCHRSFTNLRRHMETKHPNVKP